jgi:hypothetical protein
MLQESIKVSLIVVSVEQLIYLFLTRCCLLPTPPRTLQRHPMKYQDLTVSIKSFKERKYSKGKDTFDLSDW